MKYRRPTPWRRATQMLWLSLLGAGVSITGAFVAGLADRGLRSTSTSVILALLLGGSLCAAGLLHYLGYDESEARGIAKAGAVASALGFLALATTVVLWLVR